MTKAFATFGEAVVGGLIGGMVILFLQFTLFPLIREFRRERRRRRELGGLPDLGIAVSAGYPPPEDRKAFGQMMAYIVELGELAQSVQDETHAIVRAKVRDEEYELTPETARYMILLAGMQQPDRDAVWELIDEACDLLGEAHLERE